MKKRCILFLFVFISLSFLVEAKDCVVCSDDGSQVIKYYGCPALSTCNGCISKTKYENSPEIIESCNAASCMNCKEPILGDAYCKSDSKCDSLTYSILNKKQTYSIGDQLTQSWSSLPDYALDVKSGCTVHFLVNEGVDEDFYVECGDSGLLENPNTGTLSSYHCYGKTGTVTNVVKMAIKNSKQNIIAESNADSYTINCGTTTGCSDAGKPAGVPPNPPISPVPTTAQQYIDRICGFGDYQDYQAWCAWLTPRPQCVPPSYYTTPSACTGSQSCTPGQMECQNIPPISPVDPNARAKVMECNANCEWAVKQTCNAGDICLANFQCGQIFSLEYKILNKKSVYNLGDQLTSSWSSLPSYAYDPNAGCTVHFLVNDGVSEDFYVECGDSGLSENPNTGTLSSHHCYGRTGTVVNTVRMEISDNQGQSIAQSNIDSYTINCGTTTGCSDAGKPAGVPPNPPISPVPTTAQQYIDRICGFGDYQDYQAWCAWLTPRPQCVPPSYYTTPSACTGSQSCTPGQMECRDIAPISPPDPNDRAKVMECNSNCEWAVKQTCNAGDICLANNCGGSCSQPCTPNEKKCARTVSFISPPPPGDWMIQQCNANGCGWTDLVYCASDEECDQATKACKKRLCSNECAFNGAKQCSGTGAYKTCGDYDSDSCLEWSSPANCPQTQSCSGAGICSGGASTVTLSEFKIVFSTAVGQFGTSALSDAEFHDLFNVYSLVSGNTVDLSGIGQNSGQKLIDIYNKVKDSVGIQTPPTQEPVSIPGGTKEYDIVEDWYIPLLSGSPLGYSCASPVAYVVLNVPYDLMDLSINVAGWHRIANPDGSMGLADPMQQRSKLVYIPTGKVMFDQNYDVQLYTNEYKAKYGFGPNVDSIPAGKYLLSVTYNDDESYLCAGPFEDGRAYTSSYFSWVINYEKSEIVSSPGQDTAGECTNKLNQKISSGFYGLESDGYSPGVTKTYCLPLGEMAGSNLVSRLDVSTVNMGSINEADIDMVLISPSGQSWSYLTGTSDETIELRSQSYIMQPNYPLAHIESGNWTLQLTAHGTGSIKIYWEYGLAS